MTTKAIRRRFQFSLKTLLLLTALFGCGLGPIVYQRHLAQQQQRIKAELEDHRIRLVGGEEQSQRPGWLKAILGDDSAGLDSFIHVYANTGPGAVQSRQPAIDKLNQLPRAMTLEFPDKQINDEELSHYQWLTNVEGVHLDQSLITGDGLKYLRGYKNLQMVGLGATQIGDNDLKEIVQQHPKLKTLWLYNTRITDSGLPELRPLANLFWLNVGNTRVTDIGMKEIQEFQNLELLDIGNTSVTDAGLRELRPLKS